MDGNSLALGETMQIHELLNLKTVCMTTSKLMEGVVFDQDLKNLMERDAQSSKADIRALQILLQKAPVVKS